MFLLLFIWFIQTAQAWNAEPYKPNVVPLAVRSPYLSTWKLQGNNEPMFWVGTKMGWGAAVRVDEKTYWFMGDSGSYSSRCEETNFQLTSTMTKYQYQCGPVMVIASFLSPIETDNLLKQSIPFSYFSIQVKCRDGQSHSVQVYSDITGEWSSSDHNRPINWTSTMNQELTYHTSTLINSTVYAEVNETATWGSVYYATSTTTQLTYQTGPYMVLRSIFALKGSLFNVADDAFRPIKEQTVGLGFARDLGMLNGSSEEVIFIVGHVREPAISWTLTDETGSKANRRIYSLVHYKGDIVTMMKDFIMDFGSAQTRAEALDQRIKNDSLKTVGEEYRRIVELSARQAMASMEITTDGKGDDMWVFMKEISSNGDLNTVDVYFPAMPILLYLNPTMLGMILKPQLIYCTSGFYPNPWSAHDLGIYPNAFGHNDGKDSPMPVEESGNMIIMMLSYAMASDDLSLLKRYYSLLQQWTTFLVTDGLIPANQLSTDDFTGTLANQTNLAMKAIVAIQAMSRISTMVGDFTMSMNYSTISHRYMDQFLRLAQSATEPHLTLSYGKSKTWGLLYNAWPNKILNLSIVPQKLLDMQTKWYEKNVKQFGVQLDTRHTWTKSDWLIWTSAIVTDTKTRDAMLHGVYNFITAGRYQHPFSDWFDTVTGTMSHTNSVGFMARPVVGGHFAYLAEMALQGYMKKDKKL